MPLPAQIEHTVRSVLESLQIRGLNPVMTAGEQAEPRLDRDPAEALRLLPLGAKELANIKIPPDLTGIKIPIELPLEMPIDAPITLPINLPIDLPLELPGLGVNLQDIDLNATEAAADGTTLKMVLKAVEFNRPVETSAADIDPAAAAANELAYAVPSPLPTGIVYNINSKVQGLVGKVTGTIPDQGLSGSIAGTVSQEGTGKLSGKIEQELVGRLSGTVGKLIKTEINIPSLVGAITAPELLPLETTFESSLTWEVKDESGEDIPAESYVLTDAKILSPLLAFLPEFVELSDSGSISPSRRQVRCRVHVEVKVKGTSMGSVDHTVGPFFVEVPKVALPTVLAMLEHVMPSGELEDLGDWSPGGVLIGVPSGSPLRLDTVRSLLEAPLAVLRKLRALKLLLPTLPIPGAGEAATFLGVLLGLTDRANPKPPAFETGDRSDLFWVERVPGTLWAFGRKSFDNCISALILVGPPGRVVRISSAIDFGELLPFQDQGMFEVKVGPAAIAVVRTLVVGGGEPMICEPEGSTAETRTPPRDDKWNDVITSYKYLPV